MSTAYTYLSVVSLKKPSNVIWFEQSNPEMAQQGYDIWINKGLNFDRQWLSDDEYLAKFYYIDQTHYTEFHAWFNTTIQSQSRWNYNNQNNIIWTQVYLGPIDQYLI